MRIRTRIKRFKGCGLEDLVGATCLTVMWVLYKASPEVFLNGSGKRYEAIELRATAEIRLSG